MKETNDMDNSLKRHLIIADLASWGALDHSTAQTSLINTNTLYQNFQLEAGFFPFSSTFFGIHLTQNRAHRNNGTGKISTSEEP